MLASISGFGQDGPYRDRPGFDQIAQGMGGLMSITGLPGQGPVRVGIPIADLTAGLFCALGILTALLEREISGEGQWVTTSLLQAQIFMLDFQAARWLQAHEVRQAGRQRSPDQHPDRRVQDQGRPHQHRRHRPGDVGAALPGDRGAGAARSTPTSRPARLRSKNRDALNAAIEKRTVGKTSAEWIDIFNKTGVPCGPIYSIDQVFADAQVQHLGIAQGATRPGRQRAGLRRPAGRAVAHAEQDRRHAARRKASTPTRCSRNSASRTMKSRSCTQPRRL